MHGGPLHLGLLGLLVSTAGTVLVPALGPLVAGLAQHLHDGCVTGTRLKRYEAQG